MAICYNGNPETDRVHISSPPWPSSVPHTRTNERWWYLCWCRWCRCWLPRMMMMMSPYIITSFVGLRVAELGSLSSGAKMAMKIFVKRVFTIFTLKITFWSEFYNLTQLFSYWDCISGGRGLATMCSVQASHRLHIKVDRKRTKSKGDTVSYTCNPGYLLQGSAVLKCKKGGR